MHTGCKPCGDGFVMARMLTGSVCLLPRSWRMLWLRGPFHLYNQFNLTAAKLKNSLVNLLKFAVQIPLLGLTDANKYIRLINKRMGKGRESRDSLHRIITFKWLLRNKASKANIDRSATKKKKKEDSHGTRPSSVEIFRWLL